jgi:aminoglycoside 2'-N-acetyltransferase I
LVPVPRTSAADPIPDRDGAEPRLELAHTAALPDETRRLGRALLDEAFGNDFTDEDWEHALGGVHALVWLGGTLVAHGSVVQRRVLHRGRALRTGYVEGVGVASRHRRRGLGGMVMAGLEKVIRGAYDLGALSATRAGEPLYTGRGWRIWEGPTWALTPAGPVRTADVDRRILVLPITADLGRRDDELTCDWREGDLW